MALLFKPLNGLLNVLPGLPGRRASTIPDPKAGPSHAHATASSEHDGRPQQLCMEGWMQKEGSSWKTWKRRYFRLRGSYLFYYTEQGPPHRNSVYHFLPHAADDAACLNMFSSVFLMLSDVCSCVVLLLSFLFFPPHR
jgi:hypothetical protein